MKHNNFLSSLVHFVANGVLTTPPCSSHGFLRVLADGEPTASRRSTDGRPTVEYTVKHTLRYASLLLTFILLTPSNAWGASTDCSFAQGETIYFRLDNNVNWGDAGAYPAAVFYYSNNSAKDTKTNDTKWDNMGGSCDIGSSNYTKMTSLGNNMYSVTIDRNDIGYIRIVRVSGGDANYTWNNQSKMCVDDAGTKNCIYCNGWDNSGQWETYSGGRTNTCGGGDEPTTFTKGSTLYFDMNGQDWTGGHYGAIFYTSTMHNINGNDDGYWDDEHISQRGSKYTISDKSTKLTEVGNGVYSLTIPYDNATTVRVCRFNKESDTQGYLKSCSKRLAAKDLGTNNCLKLLAGGKEGTWNLNAEWSTYAEPTPVSGDLYVFGAGGTNWVTSWSQNKTKPEYKMTIQDGEATKTFYNVSGVNLEFKIWDNTKQVEYTNALIEEKAISDTDPIKRIWKNGTSNIDFDINGTADVTVHYNGTKIWLTAEASGPKHKVEFITFCSQTKATQNVADGGKATNPGNLNAIKTQEGNHEVATFGGWYADATCTQSFDFNTTINQDTKVYAKWNMRSEDFYIVGDLWMNDGTNWKNGNNPKFTKSSDNHSMSVTYIAPKGTNRFEVIRGNDWGYKVPMDVDPNSPIQINVADGHMNFNLTKVQEVTITYNGRFSVLSKDYTPTFMDNMFITGDSWGTMPDGTGMASWSGQDHQNQKLTNENGVGAIVVRNVSANQNHQFKIYSTPGDNSVVGLQNFNAPYVDLDNKPTELSWQMQNSVFGHQIPMSDNQWRNITFQVSKQMNLKITFDGGIVRISEFQDVKYDVTFMVDGVQYGEKQSVVENGHPTQPTDPTKTGYRFLGWSETEGGNVVDVTTVTITAAKTFYAKWEKKGVESVTLDQTTLKLLENGTTATLTPTILPSDVLSTTTTWSSDNTGVATVNNGVVTPVAKGTATITCTVANTAGSKSATCVVTVKGEDEDCEMILTNIYTYNIKDNTPTGGTGATDKLFDPSKQSEQPTLKAYKLQIGKTSSNVYAYDNNGVVHANSTGDYWILENAGTENNINLYYFKNVTTGKYMTRGAEKNSGGWALDEVITTTLDKTNDKFVWYFIEDNNNPRIVNKNGNTVNTSRDEGDYHLHRYNWDCDWMNYSYHGTAIACGKQCHQGNWQQSSLKTDGKDIDNPNYKQSPIEQDSKSYYRFAEGATMTATSNMALRQGDVVTVYCYNPSSATVTGTLTIGTENTTISLTAGQKLDFEYTITAKGATTAVVASNSEDFCVAGIEIARELPDTYKEPNLVWDTDLSGGVTQSVEAGAFTHTASSKSAGEITYSSSVPAVATVNATTGEVTPVAAGTTVITATIEQAGCYAEGTASYTVTLTDLPKPEIEFVTVPTEMPQGLANQPIVVTTTGGNNFNLTITEGTDATLTINESTRTNTRIEATLSMGAEATNIVLKASTDRTAEFAQNAVTTNVAVSACIPDGANIFEFTLTGSDATTNQPAVGVIGGTVDQTALGTVGTEDNPATVDVIKMKYQVDNQSPNRNFAVDLTSNSYINVQVDGNVDAACWYLIPAGTETYKPSWTNNTYQLYYIYNKATGKYLTHGETLNNSGNNEWKYYTTITTATNGKTDAYKWFFDTSKDGGTRVVNRADAGNSLPNSFVLNTCNQHHNICDDVAPKPALICGHTSDANSHTIAFDLSSLTTQAANPAMLKSVQYNEKTYYIISSEGSITLKANFKAGDVVNVDTYDRKTGEADIVEKTIQADATSFTYTTTNAYECVNNIKVWRNQVGEMVNPTLTFAQSEVTLDVQQSETSFTQVATPSVTTVSNITYQSSNTEVATVDANGLVELVNPENIKHRTSITVTATMPAVGCYNETTTSYTILVMNLTPTALQTLVDDTEAGGTLTLQDDFDNCNVTISKAIKIDAQGHKIGNLTITNDGDLTLASAMNANNLYISADQAGHVSGQLKGADNLNLEGTAYMDLSFANAQTPLSAGWYAFTVPFKVSSTQGIYNVEDGVATKLNNETQYAIMQYQGDVRAQGNYGWIKTHKVGGMLQPGTLYIIAFGNSEYDKIRFVKASGDLNTNTVAISQFASGVTTDAGWNGVGNPTLAYGNATNTGGAEHAQFLNHEDNAFIASEELIENQTYIVSSAFFIQANYAATMTFNIPATNGNLYAPRRAAEGNSEFMVEISQAGKTHDRIFLSASDEASATYEIGHDLIKMGAVSGSAKVAQMAINGYGMSLCDAEFMFDANNEAVFPLTLTAPKAGTYTLAVKRANEGQTITLLQNGLPIVMTDGQVAIDLAKGTTTEYSLVIGRTKTDVVTGNEQLKAKGEGEQKFILHNHLYIIKDNKVYDILGESGNR